jgi:hypothetical protein
MRARRPGPLPKIWATPVWGEMPASVEMPGPDTAALTYGAGRKSFLPKLGFDISGAFLARI